jgi:hypothetical protein
MTPPPNGGGPTQPACEALEATCTAPLFKPHRNDFR